MQPPLLLAALLAVSGMSGPGRDVYSVSPQIRAVENTPQRVVVECTFPEGDESAVDHRQSEKSLLAVPSGGDVSVRVLEMEFEEFRANHEEPTVVRWSYDNPGSATDLPGDGEGIIRWKKIGICRDLNLAELEVFRREDLPAEGTNRFRSFHRIAFEIVYATAAAAPEEKTGLESPDDPFADIFEKILLNAPVPESLRIPRADVKGISVFGEIPASARGQAVKIMAEGEGFHAVPLDDLEKAGLADPGRTGVALYDGKELRDCFLIRDSRWPEGALVFYSKDSSPFSRWNALWLVPTGVETMPLLEPEGSLDGEFTREGVFTDRYEEDRVFKPDGEANENQEKDWLWAAVGPSGKENGSSPAVFDFLLPLPDLASDAAQVDIDIRCVTPKDKNNRRVTMTDYSFRVADSDVPSSSLSRSLRGTGTDEHSVGVSVLLNPGQRSKLEQSSGIPIRIEAKEPATSEGREPENPLFVDFIEATYRHRLTVRDGELRMPIETSGPWEVKIPEDLRDKVEHFVATVLEGGMLQSLLAADIAADGSLIRVAGLPHGATREGQELWIAAGDRIRAASFPLAPRGERLLSREMGADSLFIVHPSLLPGISPLVEWHKQQGARVEVVRTDEIYDAFGDGTLSPHAIREFLRYAFHAWQPPAPSVVILVGDATWDYKGRFGNGIQNYVPAYRVDGSYPTDHWFVTFEGEDKLPEMMVGRIPVFDASTCLTVVKKIVDGYETPGPWRVRSLMLSDKEPEFVREIDGLLQGPYTPSYYRYEWMRLSDFPFADNFYHPESLMVEEQTKHSPQCNQAIIDWLDRGVILWDFHGHGAPNVLGHERIFFGGGSIYTDVKKLTNGRRYPLFIANTCDTARFDYAQEKWNISLGEDLLQHPDGGCIAMFLHTGRGYPGQHRIIDRLFLDSIYRLRFRTVGQIFTAAKILYLLNPKPPEPLDMMVLLGDPLTPFPLPREELKVQVNTPRLVRKNDAVLEVEFEASPGSPRLEEMVMGSGYRAYVYVTAGDHRVAWEAEDVPLQSSGLRRKVELPPDIPAGEGKVGVYFYPVDASPELAFSDAVGFATFEIEIDPAIEEELRARVLPEGRPDLRIASLVVEPTDPVNGHTIWINTTIVNQGSGEASPIEVIGFVGEGSDASRIQSWAPRREDLWTLDRLYPGQSGSVRLRWDPFADAGEQVIRVVIDPKDRVVESDETNNSATVEVSVKRKADLLIVGDLVRPLVIDGTPSLVFQFINFGECPVEQDFRVDAKFLASPDGEPLEVVPFAFLREEGKVPISVKGFFRSDPMPIPDGAEWAEIIVDPDDIVDEETHENNRVLKRIETAVGDSESGP